MSGNMEPSVLGLPVEVETPLVVTSQVGTEVVPPKAERTDASYMVLYTTETDPKWGLHKQVEARSAEAAIRAAVGEAIPDGADQFVAVPARSWRPVRIKPQTVTTLLLEDA